MLICPERKYVFFKPLKCAGTSIEHALYGATGHGALCTGSSCGEKIEYVGRNNFLNNKKRFLQHTPPDIFYSKTTDPEFYLNYTNISVVRNPWDALVSYYWWCVAEDKTNSFSRLDAVIERQDSDELAMQKFERAMTYPSLYRNDPIAHEIGLGQEISSPFIFFHVLNNKFLDHRVDRYIRFERLNDDFKLLCKELNLPSLILPHHKAGLHIVKRDYNVYYNDWMKNIVSTKFSRYIKKFDYKFGV